MSSKQGWLIIEQKEGVYTLEKGRKTHLTQASLVQIRKYLRRHLQPLDKVFRIEEDGYRFNETLKYQRLMKKR